MSEANQVLLRSVAETAYGTTPAATWQEMRFVSTNLAGRPRTVVSEEIRSDRQVTDLILVGQEVAGDVGIELSDNTYDTWLEAALGGTWNTNVLMVGSVARSFSLELQYRDWSPQQYIQFKGMRVASMALNFPYGDKVSGSFSFAGKQQLASTTSLAQGQSTTAATSTSVMNGSSGITTIKVDTVETPLIVKSIGLNLNNNMRPIEGMKSLGPSNQSYGRSMVTGNIEVYFSSTAMLTKLLAGTTTRLEWTVSDGAGGSYAFVVPKLKFNTGNPEVAGTDTDVMQRLEFTALYDSVETTNLKITRT